MHRISLLLLPAVAALLAGPAMGASVPEAMSQNWIMVDSVLGGGGVTASSPTWSELGVSGQAVGSGTAESPTFGTNAGYLNDIDLDGDGVLGGADLCPAQTAACGDVDRDGCVDAGDADADLDRITIGNCDCDDTDESSWRVPSEARDLQLAHDNVSAETALSWVAPFAPGGTAPMYDTIRSLRASDFLQDAACVESDDGPGTTAFDTQSPGSGEAFFYLVRAQNRCGQGSPGSPVARSCP